jgi:hypothetical protein
MAVSAPAAEKAAAPASGDVSIKMPAGAVTPPEPVDAATLKDGEASFGVYMVCKSSEYAACSLCTASNLPSASSLSPTAAMS